MNALEDTPRATVLAIDDDESLLRLIHTSCRVAFGDQVSVETAVDPVRALQRVDEGGLDVVITDLEMPNIDGLAILRTAKRRNAATQVIVLTGHSTHEALLGALEGGAADYVLKPIDPRELAELVKQAILRGARWRQTLASTWRRDRAAKLTAAGE